MGVSRVRTSTDFLALTLSAGRGREESSPVGLNFRYSVQVRSDATGAVIRFRYHASVVDHRSNVDQLDREGLLYAFWSFVGDADAGSQSFRDFCSDFGENEDSMTAHRTWKACKASAVKFRKLWHDLDTFTPAYVLERLADEGIE